MIVVAALFIYGILILVGFTIAFYTVKDELNIRLICSIVSFFIASFYLTDVIIRGCIISIFIAALFSIFAVLFFVRYRKLKREKWWEQMMKEINAEVEERFKVELDWAKNEGDTRLYSGDKEKDKQYRNLILQEPEKFKTIARIVLARELMSPTELRRSKREYGK